MADLKLGKLPERVPVKLTISLLPDLNRRLLDYAAAYADAYGTEEPMIDLIPAMLTAFLDGDRAFAKSQAGKGQAGGRDARS